MAKQMGKYDSDEASMVLGKAWGLAHMCLGQASETSDDGKAVEFQHIAAALRYIASQVGNVECTLQDAPEEARKAVKAARGVCEVIAADAITEFEGQEFHAGMHWRDDITTWALNALCDALEEAKNAVDDESLARFQGEQGDSHVQH